VLQSTNNQDPMVQSNPSRPHVLRGEVVADAIANATRKRQSGTKATRVSWC